jgi:hypothetical protein
MATLVGGAFGGVRFGPFFFFAILPAVSMSRADCR